jgi:hypothetical protein
MHRLAGEQGTVVASLLSVFRNYPIVKLVLERSKRKEVKAETVG